MLNNVVSSGNVIADRVLAGAMAMSLDHPFVLCAVMAAVAGAASAVLLDVVGSREVSLSDERPIRLWRR